MTSQQAAVEGGMPKRSNKKTVVLIIILVILLGLGVGAFAAYRALFAAPIRTAQVESREPLVDVYVNGNPMGTNGSVKEGDTIETKAGGKASLQLFESSIVLLDMDTKLIIESLQQDNIRLRVETGRTWHEVSGVHTSGNYSVTDGTYTATVKGTAFEMQQGGKILTAEGSVEVTGNGNSVLVNSGEVSEVKDGALTKRVASAQEKGTLAGGLQLSVMELRELRSEEIAKYPKVLELVKERFNTDEATIRQTLLDADVGKYDIEAEFEKFPIKVPVITRIAEFTKEIQQLETKRAELLK